MGNCSNKEKVQKNKFFIKAKDAYTQSAEKSSKEFFLEQEIVDTVFTTEIKRSIFYKQSQCNVDILKNKYSQDCVEITLQKLKNLGYSTRKKYSDHERDVYYIEWNFREDECMICLEPVDDEVEKILKSKKSKKHLSNSHPQLSPRDFQHPQLTPRVCSHKIHERCAKKYNGCPICRLE